MASTFSLAAPGAAKGGLRSVRSALAAVVGLGTARAASRRTAAAAIRLVAALIDGSA